MSGNKPLYHNLFVFFWLVFWIWKESDILFHLFSKQSKKMTWTNKNKKIKNYKKFD